MGEVIYKISKDKYLVSSYDGNLHGYLLEDKGYVNKLQAPVKSDQENHTDGFMIVNETPYAEEVMDELTQN